MRCWTSDKGSMDILGKKFAKKLHGYAELEVHEYLTDLARVVEGLLRERGELKQRVHHMEQELSAFRDRETALKEALVAAQRSAETTIEVARAEGQRIVAEGHGLAERLVAEANERVQNMERVIGVIYVDSPLHVGSLSASDLDLLTALAGWWLRER